MNNSLMVPEKSKDSETSVLLFPSEADLVTTRDKLIGWVKRELGHAKQVEGEAHEALETARINKWNTKRLATVHKHTLDRIVFLTKLEIAIKAGYIPVPDMPGMVFAIRTKAKLPRGRWTTSAWEAFEQHAQGLPTGEGKYVNPIPMKETDTEVRGEGDKAKKVTSYRPSEFLPVDFPMVMANAAIMNETERTMAKNLFDEIVLVQDQAATPRRDPIILGRLKNHGRHRRDAAFLIAHVVDVSGW